MVIASSGEFRGEANQVFQSGLKVARGLKSQVPSRTIELDWVHAASFPRQNGSGTPVVTDPVTGSCLIALGTWFHAEGNGSGTEARLLHRYLETGPSRLAQELDGFFAIVIADARTRETIVITDLAGSCHCFARALKHGMALSGSSLVLAGIGECSLDPVACQEFLCTGIIYEDRTLYREVRKLGPASIYRFADGKLKEERRYWKITDLAPESLEGERAVRGLWEAITLSAQKIGNNFTRPVCDLTGGYDSRLLAAACFATGLKFSTTVSGSAQNPDVVVSQGLARHMGLAHLHLTVPERITFDQLEKAFPLTDGEYDLVEYAQIHQIHQALSKSFDISLNGSFGEVARGYWWELLFPRAGARLKMDAQKLARLRFAAHSYDSTLFPSENRLDLVSHFTGIIERTNSGLSDLPNTMQMDNAYLTMRMQRWQGKIASSTNQLWPCLSPFIFRPVLEAMLQTRSCQRSRSLLVRQTLAEFQPQLAAFPLEHGYPAMPVTYRNFWRFAPILRYYGEKVVQRAERMAGRSPSPGAASPKSVPVRLQLWSEEKVRELFQPAQTKLDGLMDEKVLGGFLTNSQLENFPYDSQWGRLLTIEYLLTVLEKVRSY